MKKRKCRYCGSSRKQAVGYSFNFPHCQEERQAKVKKELKKLGLWEKDMVYIEKVMTGVDKGTAEGDHAVKATILYYQDNEGVRRQKVLSVNIL